MVFLLSPSLQALEAVDHLIHAVVGGYNTDGQLRYIVGKPVRCSGSQRRVAGTQPSNG